MKISTFAIQSNAHFVAGKLPWMSMSHINLIANSLSAMAV